MTETNPFDEFAPSVDDSDAPTFSNPGDWDYPERLKFEHLTNRLVIIHPLKGERKISQYHGGEEVEMVIANVAVLDGYQIPDVLDNIPHVERSMWIFPKLPVIGALKNEDGTFKIGEMVLVRVKRPKRAFELADPTKEDRAKATELWPKVANDLRKPLIEND